MRALIALIVMSLAGCVSGVAKPVPPGLDGSKVAVFTTVPESAFLYSIGNMSFGNESAQHDARTWNVVSYIEETAVSLLEESGKFKATVLRQQGVRDDFRKVGYDYAYTPVWDLEERKQKVRDLGATVDADLIMLLASRPTRDELYGTNMPLAGYGVYQRPLGEERHASTYAVLQIILYDAKTGEEITYWAGVKGEERDGSQWLEDDLMLSGENEGATEADVKKLYSEMLRQAFREREILPPTMENGR